VKCEYLIKEAKGGEGLANLYHRSIPRNEALVALPTEESMEKRNEPMVKLNREIKIDGQED